MKKKEEKVNLNVLKLPMTECPEINKLISFEKTLIATEGVFLSLYVKIMIDYIEAVGESYGLSPEDSKTLEHLELALYFWEYDREGS